MQGKRSKGVNLMVRTDTTPSYVLELEMKTTAYDRKVLGKKTRIGKNIYNSCLGEALKRLRAVLADRTYRMTVKTKQAISAKYHTAKAKKANKRTAKEKKVMREFKRLIDEIHAIEQSYGYSEYQLHAFVAPIPDNYNEDGTIKCGVKLEWHFSKRYLRLKTIRKDLHRKIAVKRKQSHEILANHVHSLGSDIRVETISVQGLKRRGRKTTRNKKNGKINKKKRYGKVIANRAPAMLIEIIDRKLHYQGGKIKKSTLPKSKQVSSIM